jgi:hypothetical protein
MGFTNMADKEYIPRVADKEYRARVPDSMSPLRRDPPHQPLQWGSRGTQSRSSDPDPLPWDLVLLDPDTDTWGLYAPRVIYSREDVTDVVSITNSGFSLSAGDLVVATMTGGIDTFIATPSITLEALSTWGGHPSAYEFDTASPYAWETSRIPVWSISSTDSDGAVLLASSLYGTKLISSHPTLAYTIAEVPLQSRVRVVPTLL